MEGIGERDRREDEADQFAADRLIPADRVPELAGLKSDSMPTTQRNIETFARQLGVAASIVTGRMQHEGLLARNWCNGTKRRFEVTAG